VGMSFQEASCFLEFNISLLKRNILSRKCFTALRRTYTFKRLILVCVVNFLDEMHQGMLTVMVSLKSPACSNMEIMNQ